MTKRYFYTDPLAAAYMAEHFGMRFFCGIAEDMDGYRSEVLFDNEIEFNDVSDCVEIYIHPDSLHLLEPQHKDLMVGPNGLAAMFYMDGDKKPSERCRIIQRNGSPFFWPESEEA